MGGFVARNNAWFEAKAFGSIQHRGHHLLKIFISI